MRILFLSSWFPYPPSNGSKLRTFNLLRELSRQHDVTLLSFADQPDVDPAAPALAGMCRAVEVVATPCRSARRAAWLSFLRTAPRSLVGTRSPEMEQRIGELLSASPFDLVIASQLQAASYVPSCGGLTALFEEVELGVLYEQFAHAPSVLRRLRYGLTWFKHRRYLARLLRSFRACTVVSERERALLSSTVPEHPAITVIPNGVDLADYASVHQTPQRNRLIFTGSFRYIANHDAMCWFVRDVYPLIRAGVPDIQLTITGDAADRRVPDTPGVVHTGHVADVRPLIASSWISVAPVRIGGGTRVKILEAMALGTPVVATSKGAEGLDVRHGVHLLIADTPHAFAEQVLHLLADPELRAELSRNARQMVEARYNWTTIGRRLAELVAALGGN
ncbi:MAG: putative glycosyltransferase [Deltaproteobacteria bacterium]|nr:putative glycosyltransferase [Deltaproteobacteria bacterium]